MNGLLELAGIGLFIIVIYVLPLVGLVALLMLVKKVWVSFRKSETYRRK
jgi:hypothetical protein